jgi:uncharacterized membrane protein
MTAFAGSMQFVYLHIVWFGCWIAFGVEDYPYGLLTMIVSLEAIFLSTFVMISQNRADARRQVIADQQWQTVKEERRQNEELLDLSRQILDRTKAIDSVTSGCSGASGRRRCVVPAVAGRGVAAAWQRPAAELQSTGTSNQRSTKMSVENVVVIGFTDPSKAYEALSVMKECAAEGRIGLDAAAVVERTSEGTLHVPESTDNVGLVGTASGSLIGMLLGVIGGPVGVLLGWGTGALTGGVFDIVRADKSDEALRALGQAIPAGSTAVIANVSEPAVEVIDGEMAKLGGEVTRRPVAEVMDQLEAAEEANRAAAKEARHAMREQRRSQVSASFDERVGKLKEKLHVS